MAVRTPPTDEDIWVVPSAWWSKTDPFRGRCPVARVTVNVAAAQSVSDKLAQSAERIRAILGHSGSHRVLAQRGAQYLSRPGSDPLGAAVCAAIGMDAKLLDGDALGRYYDNHADLADYLVATHGLRFAVSTVAALTGVCAESQSSDMWNGHAYRITAQPCDPPATLVRRLRTLLAAAADMDYADALDEARRLRRGTLSIRLLTSYLFPTEQHWVTADLADPQLSEGFGATFLLASVTDPALAHRIIGMITWHWHLLRDNKSLIYSLAAHLGPAATSVLIRLWKTGRGNGSAPGPETLARMLARFPDDAAMDFLAEHAWRNATAAALLGSTERFPARAMRVLAARTARRESTDTFRDHVRRHPELATAMCDELPESARRLIIESLPTPSVSTTPAELVPAILRDPPWQRPRPEPTTITTLEAPADVRVSWQAGEREEWLGRVETLTTDEVRQRLEHVPPGGSTISEWQLTALAQVELARADPYLRTSRISSLLWHAEPLLELTAAHGAAAHDLVIDAATTQPRYHAPAIAPFESPTVAALIADWLRLRSRRRIALDWLRRHPDYAATALIPGAIGKARRARRTHAAALRTLAALGHTDTLLAASSAYGATAAVRELLDVDPAEIVPARIPPLPQWLSIPELPPIMLTTGYPLPHDAVANLVVLMMLSDPGVPHAALARIGEYCDTATLAVAAGVIFDQWTKTGSASKDTWVWEALAAFGNDQTVADMLSHLLWSAAKDSALDTLAAIGSDRALSALITVTQQGRNAAVRAAARIRVDDLADELGLSADQLADRMVLDPGLRPDGTALLDFGPRQFVLGFDEQLRPTITGADGIRRKSLPKANAHDDQALAAESGAAYRTIRRYVQNCAAEQIRRLERAMVTDRRFALDELRNQYIAHPVRINLTRRLIWATYRDDRLVESFRVTADNTSVDVSGGTLELAEDADIGIAHPSHLGTDLSAAWASVLAEYELPQPFPQIGRSAN
ncbi:DUF4132 domain-containing protein [Nocardia sp. NPDC004278]